MSDGKPTITKAQEKKPEPKKLNRAEKWRAARNKKKEQRLAQEKAKQKKQAQNNASYLNAISSQQVSSETKQPTLKKRTKSDKTNKASRSDKLKKQFGAYKAKLPNSKPNKRQIIIATGVVLILVVGVAWVTRQGSSGDVAATLGENIDIQSSELPPLEPDFILLFPIGFNPDDYDVRQTNPPGNDPTYTYLDRVKDEGAVIQVTQQRVPSNFDVIAVATEFQATNIIQIDEMRVYHGRNERDNVQSLIFVKEDLLVTIRSPESYPDDTWASYIISLQ